MSSTAALEIIVASDKAKQTPKVQQALESMSMNPDVFLDAKVRLTAIRFLFFVEMSQAAILSRWGTQADQINVYSCVLKVLCRLGTGAWYSIRLLSALYAI
jgi:hypothetical protein